MAYTYDNLQRQIEACNKSLAAARHHLRLQTEHRNNYTAVDTYAVALDGQRRSSGTHANLCAGNPKDCAFAAARYTMAVVTEALEARHG